MDGIDALLDEGFGTREDRDEPARACLQSQAPDGIARHRGDYRRDQGVCPVSATIWPTPGNYFDHLARKAEKKLSRYSGSRRVLKLISTSLSRSECSAFCFYTAWARSGRRHIGEK